MAAAQEIFISNTLTNWTSTLVGCAVFLLLVFLCVKPTSDFYCAELEQGSLGFYWNTLMTLRHWCDSEQTKLVNFTLNTRIHSLFIH